MEKLENLEREKMKKSGEQLGQENKGKSIVYFVRHGESKACKSLTFLSRDKDVLNENGKRQARFLGQYFGDRKEHFTMAFTSSIPRALETAQIILRWSNQMGSKQGQVQGQGQVFESDLNHPVPLVQDPLLIERDMGAVDGHKFEDYLKEFQECKKPFVEWDRKGSEKVEDCNNRISNFLDNLLEMIDRKQEPQTILVVSHATYFLHMAKVLISNPHKFRLEGETPEYTKAMKNSAFFKVAIYSPKRESKSEPVPNPTSKFNLSPPPNKRRAVERRARTIEILRWNATDHLKDAEGNLKTDTNSNSTIGTTKEFACSLTLVANANANANANTNTKL